MSRRQASTPKPRPACTIISLGMAEASTVVLISHRLGSCRLADRILVLNEGRVVEQGTHSQLIATGGEYAELFKLQAGWYQ